MSCANPVIGASNINPSIMKERLFKISKVVSASKKTVNGHPKMTTTTEKIKIVTKVTNTNSHNFPKKRRRNPGSAARQNFNGL